MGNIIGLGTTKKSFFFFLIKMGFNLTYHGLHGYIWLVWTNFNVFSMFIPNISKRITTSNVKVDF